MDAGQQLTAAERTQAAADYWAGMRHNGRALGWDDLTPAEKTQLTDAYAKKHAPETAATVQAPASVAGASTPAPQYVTQTFFEKVILNTLMPLIKAALAKRDERITALESKVASLASASKVAELEQSVAERDRQVQRLSEHVARLQSKATATESRLHALERK